MLSDTEASCLATALAVCLKKKEKKKRRWMKEWLKPLFFRIFYPLQFFLEVSRQRVKFLNQMIISIRKSLSAFTKKMVVLLIFFLYCCCNSCSWHSKKPVKNDILRYTKTSFLSSSVAFVAIIIHSRRCSLHDLSRETEARLRDVAHRRCYIFHIAQ